MNLACSARQSISDARSWLLILIFSFSSVFSTAPVAADKKDNEQDDEESQPRVLTDVGSLVDDTHGMISEGFSSFIVQIDDFIGSGELSSRDNSSWARIRVDAVKPGAEELRFAGKVKLRIVLPQSQQRFRLLVSNEDEASSAANSDAAQRERIAGDDNNDVALALRFIRTAQDRVELKYDIGARYKDDKGQLFGRIIAGIEKQSRFRFTNTFTNNFTYFSSSGYRNNFRIDSRRNFFDRESLFFRNSFELSWRKGDKGVGIGETIGIYADLGKRRALALEGITGYATVRNEGVPKHYRGAEVRLRFRQSVWRPWFYYEIWPSVSWSSSNDYEQAYGGLFRIEVTLGKI